MTEWHAYALLEFDTPGLTLTNADKVGIRDATLSIGMQLAPQPANITHLRIRTDKRAVIMEVTFDPFPAGQLAEIEDDTYAAMAANTQHTQAELEAQSDFSLFKPDGVNNADVTWEQSRLEVIAFLAANIADWEISE